MRRTKIIPLMSSWCLPVQAQGDENDSDSSMMSQYMTDRMLRFEGVANR